MAHTETGERVLAEKPRRGTGRGVIVVGAALIAVMLVCVAVLGVYVTYVRDASSSEIAALQSQLQGLMVDEQLIASQLQAASSHPASSTAVAQPAASTAGTSSAAAPLGMSARAPKPAQSAFTKYRPKVTADEAALGMRVVVGRVLKSQPMGGSEAAISYKPGGFFEGSIAFSVAASRGDVFKGGYYVDSDTTRTIDARILHNAEVRAYASGAKAGSRPEAVTASELVGRLTGASRPAQPWRDAWYWFEIAPSMAITKVVQLPPE